MRLDRMVVPRRGRLRRPKKARPVGVAASDVVAVSRLLRGLVRDVTDAVRETLVPVLRRREPEYLADMDFADEIAIVLERIRVEHAALSEQRARLLAERMTKTVDRRNRDRFIASIGDAVGVDVAAVVASGGLSPALKAKTAQNVGLIKTIPEQYFAQIQTLVFESVVQGRTPARDLIRELRDLGAKNDRRARFIARDQTAKLNAALNRERNQALGIEEYVWRTSLDERVRPSHEVKHNKTFRWDEPPRDTGHPGEDFQCRCVARPIIRV